MANNNRKKTNSNGNRKQVRKAPKKREGFSLRPVSFVMLAFVVIIIIVLLIVIPSYDGTSKISAQSEASSEVTDPENAEITECSDSEIINLFKTYYKALSDGDSEKIKSLYDEAGDISDASSLSDVVEEYQNLRIYEAPGLNENEKAIFVYYEVKFFDVDEAAPGVDSYYITTASGEPKLMLEMYTNSEIVNYLYALSDKEPIKSLMDSTNDWLKTSLSEDSVLNEVYNTMAEKVNEQKSELQSNK